LDWLARNDPGNLQVLEALDGAYRYLGTIEGDLRNMPALIENYEKALKLDVAGKNPTNQLRIQTAQYRIRIAGAQAMAGRPEEAKKSLSEALEMCRRARSVAEQVQTSDRRNFAARRDMITDERWIAFTMERLGDTTGALEQARHALALATTLVVEDAGTLSNSKVLDEARGSAARLAFLPGGPFADVRIVSTRDTAPRSSESDVALGWRVHAADCRQVEDVSPDSAMKAVEIDRALLQEGSHPGARLSLALDLEELGRAYRFIARRGNPSEVKLNYQKAMDAFTESQKLLSDLKRSGALPESNADDLVTVAENVEIASAKLAALQDVTALASKAR
jgi:tetratricopeptide (TPR) repeat protein